MRYAACPVCLDEPTVPRRRASHGTKGARARAAVKFFCVTGALPVLLYWCRI